MAGIDKPRCEKKIWQRGAYHAIQCTRPAKGEYGGQWLCAIHSPEGEQKRQAKRDAAYAAYSSRVDANIAAKKEIQRKADAYEQLIADRDALLGALKAIKNICNPSGHAPCRCGGINNGEVCTNTCICDWPEWIKPIAEAAIAQVEAHK